MMKEIMDEVESLNRSIEEICPEIISTSLIPSIEEQGNEINELIEYRIKLLTEYSRSSSTSKKA